MRFLLVDEILEMEPGSSVRAAKSFRGDEDFFQDHFPGFPVVPGVLLVEMMAQTVGKCLNAQEEPRGKAMLARITSAQFKEWMRPGERAVMHAEIRKNRAAYATADCFIMIGEKKICGASLLFAFLPDERFAPDYRDEVLESYLAARTQPD